MASERTGERQGAPASRWDTLMQCVVALGPRPLVFLLVGAAVWLLILAVFPPINYDELALVHFAWLIGQGAVPYTDFHAVHPPFFALLVAPLLRVLPEAFGSMLVLRLVNLLASLAVLVLLVRLLFARTEESRERWLALGGLVIMASHPRVLQALAEFRPDHLSTALTLGALSVAMHSTGQRARRWFVASALFTIAMVFNAKLILIPFFTALVLTVEEGRRGLRALGDLLAGTLTGVTSSLVLTWFVGHLWAIDFRLLWEQAYVYHEAIRETFTQSFGLAKTLGGQVKPHWGLPIVVLLLGLIGLLTEACRGHWDRVRVPLILAAYAVIQPLWVPFPYKQYSYTINLAWAAPLALGLVWAQRWRPRATPTLVAALVVVGLLLNGVRTGRIVARGGMLSQMQLGNALLSLAPPGQPVAALLPVHPIFRRDATFAWIYTHNPGGRETEEVMTRMPGYQERFSHDGYLRELKANPPGLIVLHSPYAHTEYRRAVADFLAFGALRYDEVRVGEMRVFVRHDRSASGGHTAHPFVSGRRSNLIGDVFGLGKTSSMVGCVASGTLGGPTRERALRLYHDGVANG